MIQRLTTGFLLCALALALPAFAGPRYLPGNPTKLGDVCPTYTGMDVVTDHAQSHIIMLGEAPGTEQAAEALLSAVCAALEAGMPVRVGFQAPNGYIAPLNGRTILTRTQMIYWSGQGLWDGDFPAFGTRANKQMLDTLMRLRQQDHDVELFGIDSFRDEYHYLREAQDKRAGQMAARIDAMAAANPDAAIITLTDYRHASTRIRSYKGQMFAQTARQVTARPVFTIGMQSVGGDHLVEVRTHDPVRRMAYTYEPHIGADVIDPYRVGQAGSFFLTPPPNCGPTQKCALPGFDAAFMTPRTTLSPPAFPVPLASLNP